MLSNLNYKNTQTNAFHLIHKTTFYDHIKRLQCESLKKAFGQATRLNVLHLCSESELARYRYTNDTARSFITIEKF